ncbi:MAG: tRNA dihydrouridine(20/20a) synthase DusA [Myxococcales bacterium]|nr:tRNA dihydrouridine(20/20a) synthase DusA [Myxococcales bacterium]MCB9713276.1 tRNA dihydrouridine(20/20a) synthase DusA [Myxococcales bacterium]
MPDDRRGPPRPLSVAPMVDHSDRHFRMIVRAVTRRTLLYTEMTSVAAALSDERERVLGFDPRERPLALQLGGDDPERLAEAAALASTLGYDEIDLNCGCPSSRVQQGRFGAVLMKDPARVAACVQAMRAATSRPVTVKHRLGVDELDRYEDVDRFVATVAAAGADRFVVHARKAWLSGLSPKQNRSVPPLRPSWVRRLKAEHPALRIEINGGITGLDEAFGHLDDGLDGVMIGRAVYDDPMILADADARLEARAHGRPWTGAAAPTDAAARIAVIRSLLPYVERCVSTGARLSSITRHLMGLVHGLPGARRFRRRIGEEAREAAGPELLERALAELGDHSLADPPPALLVG